jgi:hypothetical protein
MFLTRKQWALLHDSPACERLRLVMLGQLMTVMGQTKAG